MRREARKLAPYKCKPIAPKKLGARKRAGRQRNGFSEANACRNRARDAAPTQKKIKPP